MGIMRQFKPGQLQPGLLYDISSSFALTASYVPGLNNIQNLIVQNDITASVQTGSNIFLISSASMELFTIQQNGVVILSTQSIELTNPAPNGGIYFTSSSFFVGLD
jgi:hypothetical protein